ncbi:MAG TPA: peptidoglycan DD-metalloendopeptidase family protein [Flavisolibacter sp.]|nr:peptidoglycan DD-metalloendopeptidase family protein [Flavisolibacter sp.]
MTAKIFEERLKQYSGDFHPVVPYKRGDVFLLLDFTESNRELTGEILKDTNRFTRYINSKLAVSGAKYGIGGYNEHRTIYSRSHVFDGAEPRRLHLGIDIWGRPYTKIMAPFDGIVHSFAFNNAFGDYGATIILTHNLDGMTFHTLYGHLSLNSLKNLNEGQHIRKGDVFTEFGIPFENGQWPPHLHFQLILDMQGLKGDYPGVCQYSEGDQYLNNCPDPDLILGMMHLAAES